MLPSRSYHTILLKTRISNRAMSSHSLSAKLDGYLFFSHSKNPIAPLPVPPSQLWSSARPKNEVAESKIFYGQLKDSPDAVTAVVSLGGAKFANATWNNKMEIVRKAVATGVKQLRDAGARNVAIDLEAAGIDSHAAGAYQYFVSNRNIT